MQETVERGGIDFLFQPKVERITADELDDVQRFFVVLHPEGRALHRRIRIGRKRLPAVEPRSERFWALVDQIGQSASELEGDLQAEVYDTKTRGLRFQPGARSAGAGRYAVVRHDDHVHLVYALDGPAAPVGDELRIRDHGNLIVLMRNPADTSDWPRFVPLDPAALDQEGADLVLVGVGEDDSLSALAETGAQDPGLMG